MVTEVEFWDCALRAVRPDRGGPATAPKRAALPLHLYRLLEEIGVPAEEIAKLDAASAAQRVAEHYAADDTTTEQ